MPLIASEDYSNKRIYLSIDSVGVNIFPIELYKEHRERRRLNASGERKFLPMVSAFGNEQIGTSKFTPRFTNLASGVKIVPYDTSHSLLIRGSLVSTKDSLEGRDLFDRTSLVANVDVDYQPPQVEIITVNSGSGLTTQQAIQLASTATGTTLLLDKNMLTLNKPVVHSASTIEVGDVVIELEVDEDTNTVTGTRVA
jgi:hypothetical protein